MNTWLSTIMLVSATAGFAVCAGGLLPRVRRRSRSGTGGADDGGTPVTAVVGMSIMLGAMADMAVGAVHLLPDVVWGLLMLLAGPLLLAGGPSRPCGFGMHRSLSMIAMAALTIAGGHGHAAASVSEHGHGGSEALPVVPVLLVVGVTALLAYTAVLVVTHHRTLRREIPFRGQRMRALPRAVVESCLAAVSVAAMAGSVIA